MTDIYLRFKFLVEVGDNDIQTCIYCKRLWSLTASKNKD